MGPTDRGGDRGDGTGHNGTVGSSGPRRRKPKQRLPRVPKYVPYPRGGYRWRLGGPLTAEHEAEAKAAERAKQPTRIGTMVLRWLGGGGGRGREPGSG